MNGRLPDLSVLAQGRLPRRPGACAPRCKQLRIARVRGRLAPHVAAALGGRSAAGSSAVLLPRLDPPGGGRSLAAHLPAGGRRRRRELPVSFRDPAERFFNCDLAGIRVHQSVELRRLGARALRRQSRGHGSGRLRPPQHPRQDADGPRAHPRAAAAGRPGARPSPAPGWCWCATRCSMPKLRRGRKISSAGCCRPSRRR